MYLTFAVVLAAALTGQPVVCDEGQAGPSPLHLRLAACLLSQAVAQTGGEALSAPVPLSAGGLLELEHLLAVEIAPALAALPPAANKDAPSSQSLAVADPAALSPPSTRAP